MNPDEILKEAVENHCNRKGYSSKLTSKLLVMTQRMRSGEVESADLNNFLEQIQAHLTKEGENGA